MSSQVDGVLQVPEAGVYYCFTNRIIFPTNPRSLILWNFAPRIHAHKFHTKLISTATSKSATTPTFPKLQKSHRQPFNYSLCKAHHNLPTQV
jgi:hypothetical protein